MSYKGPERRRGEKLRYIGIQTILGLLALLVLTSMYGAFIDAPRQRAEIRESIAKIEDERTDRIDSASATILLGCLTDNGQDKLLAKLVEVSLAGGTFGANIDPSQLTPFQLDVISAIAAVQQIAADAPPTKQERVFAKKLAELKDLMPCDEIVEAYRAGDPVSIPSDLEP